MTIGCPGRAKTSRAAVLAIALSTNAIVAGCGGQILSSAWRCNDITIDASADDWGDVRGPLEKQNVILGVANDAENLYLTFTPGDDAMQRQVLMLGLTVWFDPQGGKAEYLGIRFPRGMRGRRSSSHGAPADISTDAGRQRFAAGLDTLEVLRAGSQEGDRYAIDQLDGVVVCARLVGDVLVYELKMPLERTRERPHAIGARPGDVLGIGLQTPVMDRRRTREGMPGAGPPGGGGPGGSGGGRFPGGGGHGGSRGHGGEGPGGGHGGYGPRGEGERLDAWIQVRLAPPEPCDTVTPPASPQPSDGAATGSPDTR
jgi:hypothetical protein